MGEDVRWMGYWGRAGKLGLSLLMVVGVLTAGSPGYRETVGIHSRKPPIFRVVHLLGMSVTIPSRWHVANTVTQNGVTTSSIDGRFSTLQLARSPLLTPNFEQLIPMVPVGTESYTRVFSPYSVLSVTADGTDFDAQILSARGTLYTFNLEINPNEKSQGQRIYASWHHPMSASLTQIAHLMREQYIPGLAPGLEPEPEGYMREFVNRSTGWILLAGEPGTAQQAYYLLGTSNGGRQWSLLKTTNMRCSAKDSPCTFLGGAGSVAMQWINGNDGVLANAYMATADVGIFRTQDGGHLWSYSEIPLNNPAMGISLQSDHGVLLLSITPFHGKAIHEVSTNGGATWHA